MADAVGSEGLDDLADLGSSGGALLADVDRDPEACGARRLDHRPYRRVVVAAAARTRPRDVDADHAAVGPGDRLVDDDRVLARVEGAIHHQDQPGANLWILEPGAVEPTDRGEDDVVEVALAAAVAFHRVEAQLESGDPLRAVGAADRAVDRSLDRERGRLDQLGPVVDRVERIEVLDPARVGDRDERLELPVVLHRECDSLFVRKAPEDVGCDRAAEVGVELGEALSGGDHRLHSTRLRALARRVDRRAGGA